jgi:uncharacterized repeat protein (TIGR02543 family)
VDAGRAACRLHRHLRRQRRHVRRACPASYGLGESVTVSTAIPVRDGHIFDGWLITAPGGLAAVGGSFTMPASDVTLTAQWTPVAPPAAYTVTYNGNGGTPAPTDPASYHAGDTVTVTADVPVRDGYDFGGWLYGGVAYAAGDTFTMPASDVTLTAQWVLPGGPPLDPPTVIELPVPFALSLDTTNLLTVVYGDAIPTNEEVANALLEDIRAYLAANYPGINLSDLNLTLTVDSSGIGEFVKSYEYDLTFGYNTADFAINNLGSVEAFLTIVPRSITITAGSASKVFDGTALTTGSFSSSPFGLRLGDTLYATVSGSQTAVGSSPSGIANYQIFRGPLNVTVNYAVVTVPGTLTVTAAPVVPIVPPATPTTPTAPVAPVAAAPGPAAPAADEETITDAPTPLTPAPAPTPTPDPTPAPPNDGESTTVDEGDTPLESGKKWALLNLILTAIGALLSLVILVVYLLRRRDEDDNAHVRKDGYTSSRQQRGKRGMPWLIGLVVAVVVAIVLFVLTEDIRLPMQLLDAWTIYHAVIFIVQIVFAVVFATRRRSDDDTSRPATLQAPTA